MKKYKKIAVEVVSILMAGLMCFSLTACGNGGNNEGGNESGNVGDNEDINVGGNNEGGNEGGNVGGNEGAGSHTTHTFVNYVYDDNATCTEDGTETAKCEGCNEKDTRKKAGTATGVHSYGEYKYDDNATCTVDGTETALCSECGGKDVRTKADTATGHVYANGICNGCKGIDPSAPESTGLNFEPIKINGAIAEYSVSKGSFAGGVLVIPSEYEGKPVTTIPANAFAGHETLTGVKIPASVDVIGNSAFDGCTSLKVVELPNDSALERINYRAFYGCSDMSIDLSKATKLKFIGKQSFMNCRTISSLTAPSTLGSIWESAFENCGLKSIDLSSATDLTEIEDKAFLNCSNLESLSLPNCLEKIGLNAFAKATRVKSLTLPDSLTSIGAGSFSDMHSLTSLTFPEGLLSIGLLAFANCKELTSITLPVSLMGMGMNPFMGCTKLESIKVADGNEYFCVVDNCLIEYFNKSILVGLKNSVIPTDANLVTSINGAAFAGCQMTTITIPDNITSIKSDAFNNSTLTSITIPSTVTYIGSYAFTGCVNLTSITIPNSVTGIGQYIFTGCSEDLTINCEAASKPADWDSNWDSIRSDSGDDGKFTNINWSYEI